MLGAGDSVSPAAAVLQKAGLIQYARGMVRTTNRKGLEGAACECYGVIRQLDENPNISPVPV